MGAKRKKSFLEFINKIPLFFIFSLFIIQLGILIVYARLTIITFGQVISLFLFWTFICACIVLFFLRRKEVFTALGLNEFVLLLVVPFLMMNTFVLNYYISSPTYETTFYIDNYSISYDNNFHRYWIKNNEIPDEYQRFLYFNEFEYKGKSSLFELKIRQGAFGYKILESKRVFKK